MQNPAASECSENGNSTAFTDGLDGAMMDNAWPTPAEYAKARLESLFPRLSENERTLLSEVENIRHHFAKAMRFSRDSMSEEYRAANDLCVSFMEQAFIDLKSRLGTDRFFSKLTTHERQFVEREFFRVPFEEEV